MAISTEQFEFDNAAAPSAEAIAALASLLVDWELNVTPDPSNANSRATVQRSRLRRGESTHEFYPVADNSANTVRR